MAFDNAGGQAYLTSGLQLLLMADGIEVGTQPGYQLCKAIYTEHPHGAKIADHPIAMAMFKPRKILIQKAPDDGEMLIEAFLRERKRLQADKHIFNAGRLARVYGVATLGFMERNGDTTAEIDFKSLASKDVKFVVWDPLNTAGSLVLNQDPNAFDYQSHSGVSVAGQPYHRSRACVVMNEDPIYIQYQTASFGFSGRSVYQRALMPLKSFVMTMATDMMVAVKAGVIIAKMQSQSSAVDGPMSWIFGIKRQMVKEAKTENVISIGVDEDIETLNMQNLDGAYSLARKNIIENEAAASGTPAKILLSETFAEGFGEGTEDAKAIAQFVEGIRTWLDPLYAFTDEVAMYRAWNEEFYETVQARYPKEYGSVSYAVAFNEWRNSFVAEWPNLLEEPDSEKMKGEDVTLKATIAIFEILAPELPQEQKALLIDWLMDCINARKLLFAAPLMLDIQEIAEYDPTPQQAAGELQEPAPPKPESATDSVRRSRRPTREKLDAVDDEVRNAAETALRLGGGLRAA